MPPRLTPRERLLRLITEAEWQTTVTGMATAAGWLWYHAPENRPVRSGAGRTYVQNVRSGFPDLVMVRRRRVLYVELKRETGTVTVEQTRWLTALAAAGCEVAVWRPRDRDVAEAVLLRGEPMPTWRSA